MAIFDFTYVVDRRTDIFQARTERETVEIPGDMPISVSRDAIEFEAQDFHAVQTVFLTGISGHDVLAAEFGNDSVDQVFPCALARVHAIAVTGLAIEKELVGIFQVAVSRIEQIAPSGEAATRHGFKSRHFIHDEARVQLDVGDETGTDVLTVAQRLVEIIE